MHCVSCGRLFNYSRSQYCTGCAAANTVLAELGEDWPSESLRRLAEDIAISAARHIRALRLYTGGDLQSRGAVSVREVPEAERRATIAPVRREAPRERSPLIRSRRPRPERGQPHVSRSRSRKGPAAKDRSLSPRGPPEADRGTFSAAAGGAHLPEPEVEGEEFYSYYTSSESEGDRRGESSTLAKQKRDPPGVVPKAKAVKEEPAGPLKLESKREVQEKKEKRDIAVPATTEAGTAEDKERSKQAYLKGLEEQAAKKQKAEEKTNEATTRGREQSELKGSHLSLAADYRTKGTTSKKKRRRRG